MQSFRASEFPGSYNCPKSWTISGSAEEFEEIIGVPHAIASAAGKPKPSYKELITARELDWYSYATSSLERFVLKETWLVRLSCLISLSVWPFSLGFPTTESFIFGYLSRINEIALSVVSSPFKGTSALATVMILNFSLSSSLFFLKTFRSSPLGITWILFGSVLKSIAMSFFEFKETVIIF